MSRFSGSPGVQQVNYKGPSQLGNPGGFLQSNVHRLGAGRLPDFGFSPSGGNVFSQSSGNQGGVSNQSFTTPTTGQPAQNAPASNQGIGGSLKSQFFGLAQGSPDWMVDQAGNDVANAFDVSRGIQQRELSRAGIGPDAGKYRGLNQQALLARAAATAGARTRARRASTTAQLDRLMNAIGITNQDRVFGEGQRQFDTTFGEGQRQFNEGTRQFGLSRGDRNLQASLSRSDQQAADRAALRAFEEDFDGSGLVQPPSAGPVNAQTAPNGQGGRGPVFVEPEAVQEGPAATPRPASGFFQGSDGTITSFDPGNPNQAFVRRPGDENAQAIARKPRKSGIASSRRTASGAAQKALDEDLEFFLGT